MADLDLIPSFNSNRIIRGEDDIQKYGYYLGGTDVTHNALQQYDVMRGGYGRIFITQMPAFVEGLLPAASQKVKHLLQFANVGIDGIQGYSVEFQSMNVGYAGNTVEIPTSAKDDTTSITIKIYETSSALIRSYLDFWISGTADPYTGLSHYHGACEIPSKTGVSYVSQANQTMEAIYVATDQTGENVQYACLLANMFPKQSDHSNYVYEPGTHDLVQLSLEFTAMKYMSPQIRQVGQQLLDNYKILKNYLNFKSSYNISDKQSKDKDWCAKGGAITTGDRGLNRKIWDASQVTSYSSTDASAIIGAR